MKYLPLKADGRICGELPKSREEVWHEMGRSSSMPELFQPEKEGYTVAEFKRGLCKKNCNTCIPFLKFTLTV